MNRNKILALVLSALLVGAACSTGTSATTVDTDGAVDRLPFAPTAAFVSTSVDRSVATPHRYEAFIEIAASMMGADLDISPRDPVVTGINTGSVTQARADLGLLIGSMFDDLPGGSLFDVEELFGDPDELFIETIVDGDIVYVRAPFLAAIGGDRPAMGIEPGADGLAALGDGWGEIDLAQIDDLSAADVAELTGGGMTDITQILDVLKASTEVSELGSDTIRGADVSGLKLTTTLGELAETAGSVAGDGLLPSMGDIDPDLADTPADIEMWVDDNGQIRRVSFELDMAADDSGDGVAMISTSIDFFDYGADLSVDIPTDTTDLTETIGKAEGVTS